jgi:hypothetical protein
VSSGTRDARNLARTILALVAASLVMLLLFGTGPLGSVSQAQQPTPSATSSTSYKINFLNPSGYSDTEEEISAKDDRTGEDDDPSNDEKADTYHLVAWINQVPTDAHVEFLFRLAGDNRDVVITNDAEQTASPDTFEFDWDPPSTVFDGPITLKAELFAGATKVAEDVETDISMNDRDTEDQNSNNPERPNEGTVEDRGETIEMQYPINGGKWGVSKPRDQGAGGLIDISFSDGVDLGYMRLFYSVSPPGSEPEWTECNFDFVPYPRYPCPFLSNDDPEEVTAVAALANDTPADQLVGFTYDATFDDSGDAHRVLPYRQIGKKVAITPESQNDIAKSKCVTKFTVTVTDQEGRPIDRANLDVHAQGPTDDLSFDDPDTEPGDPAAARFGSKAPDEGDHRKEEAVDCEDSAFTRPVEPNENPSFNGFQGDHDNPTGVDIKHIETTGGTSTSGTFAFGIYSFDEGTTQLTVWSDDDNDDQRCTEEASADASIGWRDPAPARVGIPATVSDCPIPDPQQGSPTPQPTPSTEPSPSPSGDPRNCTIVGDEGDNTLTGTADDDVICAYGGNDIIRGAGGRDLIYGDAGSDEIRGGGGNDALQGADGKDVIRGAGGNDLITGGPQNDTIVGGSGRDKLTGNGGFDILKGGDGRDSLSGGTGDDVMKGALSNDSLEGGGGRDLLSGDKGRDRCRGGRGKDRSRSCET